MFAELAWLQSLLGCGVCLFAEFAWLQIFLDCRAGSHSFFFFILRTLVMKSEEGPALISVLDKASEWMDDYVHKYKQTSELSTPSEQLMAPPPLSLSFTCDIYRRTCVYWICCLTVYLSVLEFTDSSRVTWLGSARVDFSLEYALAFSSLLCSQHPHAPLALLFIVSRFTLS